MTIEWNYVVVVMSLLLLGFLLWKEITRVNKLRLIWRIITSILAVISLACLVLPVTFKTQKKVILSKEAVLLTEGFDKDSVQKFIDNTSSTLPVYTTEPTIKESSKSLTAKLISYSEIADSASGKMAALHVFGYGLKHDELEQLHHIPIVFHPAKAPAGITSVFWKQQLNAGEQLHVQGRFNNTYTSAIKIVLSSAGTSLDSLAIPANSGKRFELTTVPKHVDKAVFTLSVLQNKDTVEAEDIPVEVIQPQPFRVLMLAASPDFENKFLKNWLSQNGFAVAYRSRISKDKFQTEYVNTSSVSLNPLATTVLDKFDVLVADAGELAQIPKSELSLIQSGVQNKGLGLIVKADSSVNKAAFYATNFTIVSGKENTQKVISLHLRDTSSGTPKLVANYPVAIRSRPGTETLIKDEKSSVLAANSIYGNGKIVFTTLNNTYTLLLSGNRENYNSTWSLLLNNAVKKSGASESITLQPALPKANEPVQVIINSSHPSSRQAVLGENTIYLQQNKLLPFLHSGTWWPAETGWTPQVNTEGKKNWLYIYDKDSWSTLNAFKKLENTKRYAMINYPNPTANNTIDEPVSVSIPKIYFFLIFLISCGFLWFEKKLA